MTTRMKILRACRPFGLALVLAAVAGPALALGFGRNNNSSTLGAPLNFSVPLRFEQGEFVSVECVNVEVQLGEGRLAPQALRVTLDEARDGVADRILRVATGAPIDEPVATVEVSIGCPPHVKRSFTVLLDPPTVNLAQSPASSPAPRASAADDENAPPRVDTPLPPGRREIRLGLPEFAASKPKPAPRTARPVVQPAEERQLTTPTEPAANTTPRSAVPVARSASGPRLRLDAPERPIARPAASASAAPLPAGVTPERLAAAAVPASAPSPASSAAAAVAASAVGGPSAAASVATPAAPAASVGAAAAGLVASAASAPASAPLPPSNVAMGANGAAPAGAGAGATAAVPPGSAGSAADRMAELQAQLAQVSAEAASTRSALLSLESRLREGDGRRIDTLVYALAALIVVLIGVIVAMAWWIRKRERERRDWWQATQSPPAADGRALAWPELGDSSADPGMDSRGDTDGTPPMSRVSESDLRALDMTVPAARLASTAASAPTVSTAPAAPTAPTPMAAGAAGPSSAAELLDLEQQAEFFIALGQDGPAADVLERRLAQTTPASPLALARLLALHHRRGDRAGFEAARDRHAERHGAWSPDWQADAGRPGDGLEADPGLAALLANVWASPARAIAVLDRLIARRPEQERVLDLPTLLDLLWLHDIARQRLELG